MKTSLPSPSYVRWQCRRGMLELDMVFLSYFDNQYVSLNLEQKKAFIEILTHTDAELYGWLIGTTKPDHPAHQHLMQQILENKWKE